MRICVLSDEHYPYQGPDTEVVINTAAALGTAGADVSLIVPRLWSGHRAAEEVRAFYGVPSTFKLLRMACPLPTSRRLRLEKLFHGLTGPAAAALLRAHVVHTRDLLPLAVAHLAGLPWCFETYRRHAAEKPWLPPLLRYARLSRGLGAVAHSHAARADLIRLGFAPEAVLTAHVGFAQGCVTGETDTMAVRRRYHVPSDRPVVGYLGNVGPSKGIGEVFDIAGRLPDVNFLIVGGSTAEVGRLQSDVRQRGLGNVTLTGHRPAAEAPALLYAADVLIAPALFRNTYFASETINRLLPRVLPGPPMKLFNYLAAGRPIVAADQPHMREVLRDGHTALLVPPLDVEAGAGAIRRLLGDPALAARLAANGKTEAAAYTWKARGEKMLRFFESRLTQRRR